MLFGSILNTKLFSEQSLAPTFQPYLPSPVGLWPLSKATGPADVTANKIPGNESWIAYDPLYTPGVDFTNILQAAFLYKSVICSYYLLTVWVL